MKNYSLRACEECIEKYVNKYNGHCTTLEEGVLGLGTVLLHGGNGRKTIIIKEFYISAWASGHNVRQYNKMPKKYEELLETVGY
jgi:hypothetical protein